MFYINVNNIKRVIILQQGFSLKYEFLLSYVNYSRTIHKCYYKVHKTCAIKKTQYA